MAGPDHAGEDLMAAPKLLAELQESVKDYTESVGHAWDEIPGAIAEVTLVELIVKVSGQYGEDVSLADVAGLLGLEDCLAG